MANVSGTGRYSRRMYRISSKLQVRWRQPHPRGGLPAGSEHHRGCADLVIQAIRQDAWSGRSGRVAGTPQNPFFLA
jgi:hypothetical protein